MNVYVATVALHAVVAVVGIGLLGAIPITASQARCSGVAASKSLLESLFRYTQWSLAIMLLTGVLLDFTAGGGFPTKVRGSALPSVSSLSFVCHARARRAFRRGLAPGGDAEAALRTVERLGWVMCAIVGLIVWLACCMEVKPTP